ncbi:MAG: hypothetical protein MZV64_16600 [Ignavibacteriales bacterium]|nr:hypothetical protein [Ignavibacteriales bacterium]
MMGDRPESRPANISHDWRIERRDRSHSHLRKGECADLRLGSGRFADPRTGPDLCPHDRD